MLEITMETRKKTDWNDKRQVEDYLRANPLRYIQDPGHGWLEVPLELLNAVGAILLPTEYSYLKLGTNGFNAGHAYLEEDWDFRNFEIAFGQKFPALMIARSKQVPSALFPEEMDTEVQYTLRPDLWKEVFANDDCFVRRLPGYETSNAIEWLNHNT